MLITPLTMALTVLLSAANEDPSMVETQAAKSLATVPGKSAFLFAELTSSGVKPLFGHNADESFAVGSSFKLYILGTLIDEVNGDRRQLSDTMRLERKLHGPPASEMAEWPIGMHVTLNTLALKMIWVSDNTATDHLHHLLGRERIEQQMQAMGHSHPEVNRPLLNTREMTLLRDRKQGMPGEAYQKLDDKAKRVLLAKLDQGEPDYEQLDFDTAAYKLSEWYASPRDMAHALDWIYQHTGDAQRAHKLRDVLAVDIKLTVDPKIWPYAGFKGGSEDQILAGNWLLQHANGNWYTFHVFFNNPDGPVKPEQVLPVMEGLLRLIEPTLKK